MCRLLPTIALFLLLSSRGIGGELEAIRYHRPDLVVDLGVGLGAILNETAILICQR